jgi:hypothetical protein
VDSSFDLAFVVDCLSGKLRTWFMELEPHLKSDEFGWQRCEHSNQPGSSSVLILAPAFLDAPKP